MGFDWDKFVPEAHPDYKKAKEAEKPAEEPAQKRAPEADSSPREEWKPGTVPEAVRQARAVLRGKEAEEESPAVSVSRKSPASSDIFPQTAAQQKNRALMATAEIGKSVADKGIYAGTWQPADIAGRSLSQRFYVFAAPKDLVTNFNQAARLIRDWDEGHRYKGLDQLVSGQSPEDVVFKALETGTYKGEWFIPPFEILHKNLYRHRELFNGAAAFEMADKAYYCHRYLSSTLGTKEDHTVQHLHFSDGSTGETHKSLYTAAIRPVRLEPVL